jgi:hypothetical protein
MKKLFFLFLFVLLLSIINFSQTATKIDEMSYLNCGDALMRMDSYYQSELINKPQNKLYVIYYEGAEKRFISSYNSKTKKHQKILVSPRFGNALNRAKEIPLYLKMAYKVPSNRVVLIDGGFQKTFGLEIWSVPEGAEIPQATPTVERKDVIFSKLKPSRVHKLALCYSNY